MRFTEIAVDRRMDALPRVDGTLSGEVREWCADYFVVNLYSQGLSY